MEGITLIVGTVSVIVIGVSDSKVTARVVLELDAVCIVVATG